MECFVLKDTHFIQVYVVFASITSQAVLEIFVLAGSTIRDAIIASGILEKFHEIDLEVYPVGIFSKRCQLDTLVNHCDQVEIYRPLIHDPKQARRRRANLQKN